VLAAYRPAKEPLETYITRLEKQARAIEILGTPLGEGVLEVLKAKASYDMRLYEEAPENSELATMTLKREYAFEQMDLNDSPEQAARINALESMLEERGVSHVELKARIAAGKSVSPTPILGTQPSGPRPSGPAAGAAQMPQEVDLYGQGEFPTPRSRDDETAEHLRERAQRAEAELTAHKLTAGQPSASPVNLSEVAESLN